MAKITLPRTIFHDLMETYMYVDDDKLWTSKEEEDEYYTRYMNSAKASVEEREALLHDLVGILEERR